MHGKRLCRHGAPAFLLPVPRITFTTYNPFWLAHMTRTCTTQANAELTAEVHGTEAKLSKQELARVLIDRFGKELDVQEMEDWHKITKQQVQRLNGGSELFQLYPSLRDALIELYPDYSWQPNKFASKRGPNHYWNKNENLQRELKKMEKLLGIQNAEDWYNITMEDMWNAGFSRTIKKAKLAELLTERYPGHPWEKLYLLKGRGIQQRRFAAALAALFPGVEMKENVRSEGELMQPDTDIFLELDIYMPSLSLAFEFQEHHHYTSTPYNYSTVETIKKRDEMKKKLAEEKGITLIAIPGWWDGTRESLAATIRKVRSELLSDMPMTGAPIPEELPPDFLKKYSFSVEGIGEPTAACFFTTSSINPAGWWMFEKYDGVRGFWNPQTKQFYSRTGRTLPFPQHIIDAMPTDIFLDGEVWFGRENFEESMKLVHRMDDKDIAWSKFKYMVFDVPNDTGTYAERYQKLLEHPIVRDSKYIGVAEKVDCKDIDHLEKFFQDCVDKGGEGIILRDPSATLQPGRSKGYLKHKKFRDAEARIVGIAGTHLWECELPNGVTFTAPAGTSEFLKRHSPQKGDIVSFKHRGYLASSKKPKFPTIYRLRTDVTWEDVVNNWKERKVVVAKESSFRLRAQNRTKGYWKNIEHRREFFLAMAKDLRFDPMVPENWHSVSIAQVIEKKGRGLLIKYKSLINALQATFPEIQFSSPRQPHGYWDDIENRRKFFIEFAEEQKFDPFRLENWAKVSKTQLASKKGSNSIINKFNGLIDTIIRTFPELKPDKDYGVKRYQRRQKQPLPSFVLLSRKRRAGARLG